MGTTVECGSWSATTPALLQEEEGRASLDFEEHGGSSRTAGWRGAAHLLTALLTAQPVPGTIPASPDPSFVGNPHLGTSQGATRWPEEGTKIREMEHLCCEERVGELGLLSLDRTRSLPGQSPGEELAAPSSLAGGHHALAACEEKWVRKSQEQGAPS